MKKHATLFALLAAIAGIAMFLLPASGADDDLKSAGQAVFQKYADSVLFVVMTVEIQVSVATQNQTTEGAVEVLATVVNDEGLVVVSNSSIDLEKQVKEQISGYVPAGMEVNVASSVKSAKIIMPDGAEVDANVVLQDADLDIAFLQAASPEGDDESVKFLPAPFDQGAPRLQPLDDIVLLGRLGQNLNRAAAVSVGRIESVIRRPRLLYRADVAGLGQPVFDGEGMLVGLFVRQTSGDDGGALIIRPVKDVLKVADQIDDGSAEE